MTHDLKHDLQRLLVDRESLTPDRANDVTAQIKTHISEYRRELVSPKETRDGKAFRKWHPTAIRKLTEFHKWIIVDPIPPPARTPNVGHGADYFECLAWDRQHIAKEVEDFIHVLRWQHHQSMQGGRPGNWPRVLLEESVGCVLTEAGIRPTTSERGTYAQVLEHIYVTIGKSSWNAAKAVRSAIARHPEWDTHNPVGSAQSKTTRTKPQTQKP